MHYGLINLPMYIINVDYDYFYYNYLPQNTSPDWAGEETLYENLVKHLYRITSKVH